MTAPARSASASGRRERARPHHALRRGTRPPAELPEAVQAQIAAVTEVLQEDAAAAGVGAATVEAAVAAAVPAYRYARVHAYIGLLVEREVRQRLHLARRPHDPTPSSLQEP